MTKYNYKRAAALWDEYFDLCICDMGFMGTDEAQQERRYFMRTITRKDEDIKLYLDCIKERIEDIKPIDGLKSRCFDFEAENELLTLQQKILNFEN